MAVGQTEDLVTSSRRWHAAQLACVLITAYFSYAHFQVDESVQILGFLATKLGFVAPEHLPWEYAARIRPWFQVSVYYGVARVLSAVGVQSPDALAWALRTVTGLYAFAAVFAWTRIVARWLDAETIRTRLIPVATLLGFLPYLMVRVSSEAMSGATFAFAAVVLLRRTTRDGAHAHGTLGLVDAMGGGALLACAFEFRFQTALAGAGLVAWLVVRRAMPWRAMLGLGVGGTAVLLLAALVDRWGYGAWCFPPWRYLTENLGVSAARFGRAPWYAYLYLPITNVFFPVAVACVLALIALWIRRRDHVLTWVTLPFVIVHSVLGHKEERFLFPLVFVCVAIPAVLWPAAPVMGQAASRVGAWVDGLGKLSAGRAFRLVALWNFAAMLLVAVYPLGWHHHVGLAAHIRREFPHGFVGYATDADFTNTYPFYRPPVFRVELVEALDRHPPCATAEVLAVYPLDPRVALGRRVRLRYTEWPLDSFSGATKLALFLAQKYNAFGPDRGLQRLYWGAHYTVGPSPACPSGTDHEK